MIITLILITLAYLCLIGSLIYGFDKVEEFQIRDNTPRSKFSIIIPFRNESKDLPLLLTSITKLKYPKNLFEIIFINDNSTDGSLNLVQSFFKNKDYSVTLLENEKSTTSPKKDALTMAIAEAKNPWIVTTDADCKLPRYWLDAFDTFIETEDSELIVGPVEIYNSASFLDRFQALDNLSLQAATIGGFGISKPFLSNGANLCYTKDLFNKLKGFNGNDSIASGDDIFMLQKAYKEDKLNVGYIKSEHSIVQTTSQPNGKSLVSQRVRWASKTRHYKSAFAKLVGLIVLLMNSVLIAGVVLVLLGLLSSKILFYSFIIKVSLDFLLIFKASRFFNKEALLLSFISACLVYPVFTIFVAIKSSFGRYKWKGREFRT